jgi:hypothetical protein
MLFVSILMLLITQRGTGLDMGTCVPKTLIYGSILSGPLVSVIGELGCSVGR